MNDRHCCCVDSVVLSLGRVPALTSVMFRLERAIGRYITRQTVLMFNSAASLCD